MTVVSATCPHCGARSERVPVHLVGRDVSCPRCKTKFRVPSPASAEPAATTPEAPAPTTPEGPAPTTLEGPLAATPEGPLPTTAEGPLATTPESPAVGQAAPATPGARSLATDWQVGEVVLGLYEVTAVLGQGGMGRVYKARHRGWDLDLAVKSPLAQVLEAAGGAEAFEREAETWVHLGLHPHIVTCYYVRRVHGVPRVFAEFVDGGSLHEWIRVGRLRSLEAILDTAIQFAWGLHYAHEQGLVHRDVKPGNVMIGRDGVAKVTDFGLARAGSIDPFAATPGDSGGTLLVKGGGAGTPAYMPPEQVAGADLTRRSDLWSFALSVLEMFNGGRHWEYGVAAAEVLEALLDHGPQRADLPRMPEGVVDLLRRSFREDPNERPHDLAAAAADLRAAYLAALGRLHPRPEPRAGSSRADSLNNSAVSLLDLDREAEALGLWTRALAVEPQHLEATYNRAVFEWTRARIDDAELERRLAEARRSHERQARAHQLTARVLLGLGEYERAAAAIEESVQRGAPEAEVVRDRALALAGGAATSEDPAVWGRVRDAFARAIELGESGVDEQAGHALALSRSTLPPGGQSIGPPRSASLPDVALPGDFTTTQVPGQERRLTLRGLAGPALALALSSDGGQAIGGGGGREARVWDLASGALLRKILAEDGTLRALALSGDGRVLLWAAEGAPLRAFDLEQGKLLRSFQRVSGSPLSVALLPDRRHAVAGMSDRTLRVFDLESGQCVRTLEGHEDAVLAVAACQSRIVSGSRDATVRVWDAASGAPVTIHRGHVGRVNAVAFDEARGRLASGGEDRTVRLWSDAAEPVVLRGPTQAVSSLAFDPSGRFLLAGSLDRGLRFFSLAPPALHAVVRLDAAVHALAAVPGRLLAGHGTAVSWIASPERSVWPALALCRPASAAELALYQSEFDARVDEARIRLASGDLGLALDAATAARAVPGFVRAEPALQLWDELSRRLPCVALRGAWEESTFEDHSDQVLAVAAAPDGTLASAGTDRSVRVRAADSPPDAVARTLGTHEGPVAALAFTPGLEPSLWSAGWDRTVRAWDLATGAEKLVLRGHEEYVVALAVSPDTRRIASASLDHSVRLWRSDGRFDKALLGHTGPVAAVAWSPDGRVVASAGWDETVRLWDPDSGAAVGALLGHRGNVNAVAVSPAGVALASGGADGSVRLWDPSEGRESRALLGHAGEVTALAFTPDGRHLVSAGRDGTVRVWNAADGSCARVLSHPGPVLALALLPGAPRLVSGGADRKLHVWRLDWELQRPEDRLRLKPETIRIAPPTEPAAGPSATRGPRPTRPALAAAAPAEPAAGWSEVRKAAPKTLLRAPAAPRAWPMRRVLLVVAGLVGLALSVLHWLGPSRELRLVEAGVRAARVEPDLIDLAAFQGECDGDYAAILERATSAHASAPDLACLAQFEDAGVAADFLAAAPMIGEDGRDTERLRRNALSLLVGLGEAGVAESCDALGDERAEVRRLVAEALVEQAGKAAATCLDRTLRTGDAPARAAAFRILPRRLARGEIPVELGFGLVQEGLGASAPEVRAAALGTLALFDVHHARPLAEAALTDPDPGVRQAAEAALRNITAERTRESQEGVR